MQQCTSARIHSPAVQAGVWPSTKEMEINAYTAFEVIYISTLHNDTG